MGAQQKAPKQQTAMMMMSECDGDERGRREWHVATIYIGMDVHVHTLQRSVDSVRCSRPRVVTVRSQPLDPNPPPGIKPPDDSGQIRAQRAREHDTTHTHTPTLMRHTAKQVGTSGGDRQQAITGRTGTRVISEEGAADLAGTHALIDQHAATHAV
mmetsp:Transcript_1734/g.5449  ORF Transcript_1734/g.5449 Transcript_1734/m.5449 type:complete len:156 (-) Transcript_1734:2224-2691(-)|eukprot:scaffold86310_cov31-Tisochrysis_lutea.AAC.4